jgi:hypothetical protein
MDELFTSLLRLIVRPEDYTGKIVRVIGFGVLEHEGTALYVSEFDGKAPIMKNAVWLDLVPTPQQQKLNRRVMLVEGTFNPGTGHLGMFSGSLKDITRLEPWDIPTVT